MLSDEQLAFILYNNRSVEGVVSNFFPRYKFDPFRLIRLESFMDKCSASVNEGTTIEINKHDLDSQIVDIEYGPADLEVYTDIAAGACLRLFRPITNSQIAERQWLTERGITEDIILEAQLGSLSYVLDSINNDQRSLDVLGISCHPSLRNLLLDDLTGGGIVMPLFTSGKLRNFTIRRISDVGKLKYTQSCPEMDIWGGLEDIKPEYPLWMTEGIFDAAAIRSINRTQAVSVSSAMWSVPQLIQLLDTGCREFRLFCDNDKAGLRSALVIQKFLIGQGRDCRTYVSRFAKDPAEHFLEKRLNWSDVLEISITEQLIINSKDTVFNFTNYLKNRTF